MFPWELRSIDCSERTEITTLFVIGKGKEGRRGRRIRNVTFFLICLKVSFFEKSYQKSHEVVITFLLPLLKTRTWVLWHEIVQSHMKTAEMWIWRHERRWKSFPFKLLLTPFCYWMYCVRRGWKVGPPPSRWVPFLMKNWNPPLLSLDKCEGYQPLNDFIKLLNQVKVRNIRPKKALLQLCRRSNIESYTCCGCRQLKYTLMNYASTNTRNQAGVQSTPPPLIFVLEGLYQQYHAWIYVAIGCVNLTSISE